ncbi:hypothetical protein GCM10023222_28710 [Saccharopolyspora cebuensis]
MLGLSIFLARSQAQPDLVRLPICGFVRSWAGPVSVVSVGWWDARGGPAPERTKPPGRWLRG